MFDVICHLLRKVNALVVCHAFDLECHPSKAPVLKASPQLGVLCWVPLEMWMN